LDELPRSGCAAAALLLALSRPAAILHQSLNHGRLLHLPELLLQPLLRRQLPLLLLLYCTADRPQGIYGTPSAIVAAAIVYGTTTTVLSTRAGAIGYYPWLRLLYLWCLRNAAFSRMQTLLLLLLLHKHWLCAAADTFAVGMAAGAAGVIVTASTITTATRLCLVGACTRQSR
jgi:hypothetical protein